MKPALALVPATPAEKARVIGITFRRNDAHELRCIQAIRARSHPAWSQHHVSWRLGERMALRGVG
jgi:hypothetical protein